MPADYTVPDTPVGTLRLDDTHAAVVQAQADATQALSSIGQIASDNVLAQGEKSAIIRDYDVLTSE